jgi:hypothetical protein
VIPASPELMRLYADYLNREYGALDSDYVFVNRHGKAHTNRCGSTSARQRAAQDTFLHVS